MSGISVAFNSCFGEWFEKETYLPMLQRWGNLLEKCYGIGFPRNYIYTNEPIEKMQLTKIPTRMRRFIFEPYCKVLGKADYYPYTWQGILFDEWVSRKIKHDGADVFLTRSNMQRTISLVKECHKELVVLATSSEPVRQYNRYIRECDEFGIKNRSVYGDANFRDRCDYGYKQADRIVTISKVSNNTYLEGGYTRDKLFTVPLTGSSFEVDENRTTEGKRKAFISTAFHSMIKGTHRLLLAWRDAKIEGIPLVIIGRVHDDLKEFIDKHGPFKNVIFEGHRNDLSQFYDGYDAVGILMSLSEGACRTTPELMSKGFPMIVSPDATCDIVEDGKNGFIINSEDVKGLAERLQWFAEDWERVNQFRDSVYFSVKNRKSSDYGLELAEYVLTLI